MKGTSPSRASGGASSARRGGPGTEVSVHIVGYSKGEVMNKIDTLTPNDDADATIVCVIGIDLAKNVFALDGVNRASHPVLLRPRVRRDQLIAMLAQMPPRVNGMEGCRGAHHYARQLAKFGHTSKLMAPKFVAPNRMGKPRCYLILRLLILGAGTLAPVKRWKHTRQVAKCVTPLLRCMAPFRHREHRFR